MQFHKNIIGEKIMNNNNNKKPYTEGDFTDIMLRDTAKFQEKYGFEVCRLGETQQ